MNDLWGSGRGRILISASVGLICGFLISLVADRDLSDPGDRPPQVVELIIPTGTADAVAAGQAPPSIPSSLDLFVGDTVLVQNDDIVPHELGPIWVPAGATGQLLIRPSTPSGVTCSFRPEKYLGLGIQGRLALLDRLIIILQIAFPFAFLFGAFSIAMSPLAKRPPVLATSEPGGPDPT